MQNLSYNNFCLAKQKLLMAGPELPSHFEVIVIGTGLEESIVAAAAARNGHTVLHIDINDYYGSEWSAFTFDGLQKWAAEAKKIPESKHSESEDLNYFLKDGESLMVLDPCKKSSFKNVQQKWFVPPHVEEPEPKPEPEKEVQNEEPRNETDDEMAATQNPQNVETKVEDKKTEPVIDQAKITSQSKRFSLDLMPHLLFARGSMVELLIKSNISRYTEFKAVTRVLTVLKGVLEHVPSSRSDVFSTKHISVIEKRILMKFIGFCVNYEAQESVYSAFKDKTFHEFLKHEKLTENLIHFVLHSIAMVDKQAGCLEGLAATQKFLLSLGRFGNTPFLWPMYGSGELPQAFCRLCAVFGGVYYLDRPVEGLVVNTGRVVAIISKGQRIDCQHLVVNSRLCPDSLKGEYKEENIQRKICLLSESVMPTDGEQLSFLSLAPNTTGSDHFIYVQEVSYGGAACPKGIHCLHMTTEGNNIESLEKGLDILVPNKEGKLLWSTEFEISSEIFSNFESSSKLVNLFMTSGPVFELDFDSTIERAAKLVNLLFPGEEFLPRAPDPEEIIIGGEDEGTNPDVKTDSNIPEQSTIKEIEEHHPKEEKNTEEVKEPQIDVEVEEK